jgi:hypothetical protein
VLTDFHSYFKMIAMKNRFLLPIIIYCIGHASVYSQSTGIGTNSPNSSAVLDIQSTNKGMLIPRMTSAQRNLISSPATGLLIFDSNTGSFWFKSTGNWVELVDTLNNAWKKNGLNTYLAASGNVGLGTSSPSYDLHISRPSPSLGFTDVTNNHVSGSLIGDSSNLLINAYKKSSLALGQPGNLLLQTNSQSIPSFIAGNVGIGTLEPDVKLHVSGGSDVGNGSGGYLQLGNSSSTNIGLDNNEIQARNNGAVAKLTLQFGGGDLQIGGTPNIIITSQSQLYRDLPLSSNADLLPIAYAKVGASGSALSGTGNLSVQHVAEGNFRLVLLGENNMYLNRNNYTILVTANTTIPHMIMGEIKSDNSIQVRIAKPWVNWTNNACGCSIFSYISNAQFYEYQDIDFSILVYKM